MTKFLPNDNMMINHDPDAPCFSLWLSVVLRGSLCNKRNYTEVHRGPQRVRITSVTIIAHLLTHVSRYMPVYHRAWAQQLPHPRSGLRGLLVPGDCCKTAAVIHQRGAPAETDHRSGGSPSLERCLEN